MGEPLEKQNKQDVEDALDLVELYVPVARCCGGRLIHEMYCCPHCESDIPEEICFATNTISLEELFNTYNARKARKDTKPEMYDDQLKKIRIRKGGFLTVFDEKSGATYTFPNKTEALEWVKAYQKFDKATETEDGEKA